MHDAQLLQPALQKTLQKLQAHFPFGQSQNWVKKLVGFVMRAQTAWSLGIFEINLIYVVTAMSALFCDQSYCASCQLACCFLLHAYETRVHQLQ